MLDINSASQRQAMQEQIISDLLGVLEKAPPAQGPADLERFAGILSVALEHPGVPAEVGSAVVDALADQRGANAAGVLAALSLLGPEPLAERARASVRRLAADGVASPAAEQVGQLRIEAAMRVTDDEAELIAAVLERTESADRQVAVFGIEHAESGGALIECRLAPPEPAADALEVLDGVTDAPTPERIGADEVTRRVIAAARRGVDLDVAPDYESGVALPILSRVLTGDSDALPHLPAAPAINDEDDETLVVDPADDEDGFHAVVETLLEELEEHARTHHPPGGAMWEHGDFVASTMLEWKGNYGDGRLGHWARADLAEFLLEYFPRKVMVDEESLAAVPDCALGFLQFLASRGSLSGEPLEWLEDALDVLRDEFEECARDRSNWGLAKSMMLQTQSDGADPRPTEAVDAWIADFNARPREERDVMLAPAADRVTRSPQLRSPSTERSRHKQRSQRRKGQKAARKRNRQA
jgi:hypothetical protein